MKVALFCTSLLWSLSLYAQPALLPIEPVNFSLVTFQDAFWKPRMDKVSEVTIPVCIRYTETKTGRIRNFERAAGQLAGAHEGIYYDDSDVYKALEAIAYALKNKPDPALEQKADSWIEKIAAAQRPDGYLNTYYTLTGIDKRWTDMEKHEDYCAGHLIEAAVAYFNTTGKRKLLDVAQRFADHMDTTFRLRDNHWVTGHQELELALVRLYHVTQKQSYLDFARWLIEQRGRGYGKGRIWDVWKDPRYCQDDVPVRDATAITGHAVRAMYLYTGVADVASLTRDTGYFRAMERVWQDVTGHHLYLTGGIGASGKNEGFGSVYDLPNSSAYCETCASVGMVLWNHRMFLLTGDSKYLDILERSLYNAANDGLSLSGDRFFYDNPLESQGQHARREWFGTACCPSNIARLLSSLGNYVYGHQGPNIWVNLYAGSETTLPLPSGKVRLRQTTRYPWDGYIRLQVDPESPMRFDLRLRLPGWAGETAVAGGLYHFLDKQNQQISLKINGKPYQASLEKGFLVVGRDWKAGDEVILDLPMPVRLVAASDSLADDRNRVALQRGPLVYCLEGTDNGGAVHNLLFSEKASFNPVWEKNTLGGVNVLYGTADALVAGNDGVSVVKKSRPVKAIPYYAWNNRGSSPMLVWIPKKIEAVSIR